MNRDLRCAGARPHLFRNEMVDRPHAGLGAVNFLIPHSFNPVHLTTRLPPVFLHWTIRARWPLYRVFADYTTRLSSVAHRGRHVCPVALFSWAKFPCGSHHHSGRHDICVARRPHRLDWIPYEVFEQGSRIADRELHYTRNVIVCGGSTGLEVIPYPTLV